MSQSPIDRAFGFLLSTDEASLSSDLAQSKRFLEAELFPDRPTAARHRNWVTAMQEYETLVAATGRPPTRAAKQAPDGKEAKERSLAYWAQHQRRSHRTLCSYQIQRLEAVTGWTWEPLDDTWDRAADQWASFVNEAGRTPRRSGSNAGERYLAVWASHQRARQSQGVLEKHRVDILNAVPMWTWASRRRKRVQ